MSVAVLDVAQIGLGSADGQGIEHGHGIAAGSERRDALLELVSDVGHVRHDIADQERVRCLLLEVREIGQRLGHVLVSDEQRGPGQLLILRGPIGQPGGDLDAAGNRRGLAEGA